MHRCARFGSLSTMLVVLMLSACGGEERTTTPSSQVAAKVNKQDLSVHQLNEMLARAGNVPAGEAGQFSAAMLERLIDQELFVQQAKDRKLDRDPKVILSMELARREILARAYAEQVTGVVARVSDSEIADFYAANPGLFSKRRIYNLHELNVQVSPERYDELSRVAGDAADLGQIESWLKAQGIAYSANSGTRPAEQLPLEVLNGLLKLNSGQLAISRTPNGALLLRVDRFREEPIDQDRARPFIEQYLMNRAKTELAKAELARLRSVADVEYVGQFKPDQSKASAGVSPAAPLPSAVTPDTTDSVRSALEKGTVRLN